MSLIIGCDTSRSTGRGYQKLGQDVPDAPDGCGEEDGEDQTEEDDQSDEETDSQESDSDEESDYESDSECGQ